MKNHFSRIAFWISAVAILSVVLAFPRYNRPGTEATLAWDVSGYYLYLPAIFIYKDLKEVRFLPEIIRKYQPSFAPDQAYPLGNGRQVMKYSAGMAVLYLPFFFIAHSVAKLAGFPADGFSLPYQVAIQLGGVLVALLGLWYLRKNLLRFFSDQVTGWAILLLALGTNFFNYATFDAANPHVWLFTLLALVVHFTLRWHERPNLRDASFLGLCIGLAALVRPTEILYALVPVLWGVANGAGVRLKTGIFMKNFTHLVWAGFIIALVGFIQLAYWKSVAGEWIVYSYQDQGFSFLHPHVADVLFSYRKGWFVYTPLMLLSMLGFYFLFKKNRELFVPVFVFFLLNTWVVCSWDIWWYGGAFGQRAMIQSYPLLAFPLAAFLAWLPGNKWTMWLFSPLLATCLALNLFQTYQAHWGPWEADMMNRAYYWLIFANVDDLPSDKLLLDTKESFSGEKKNVRQLYFTDFEPVTDSVGISRQFFHSGARSACVDALTPFSYTINLPALPELKPGQWLHTSAWFFGPQKEWEVWWMPQLVVHFEHQGKPVHERIVRPFRVLNQGEWGEVGMDFRVPEKDVDNVKIFLWNPANRVAMYMDDLKVEVFEE
jgi:hypothetical protein